MTNTQQHTHQSIHTYTSRPFLLPPHTPSSPSTHLTVCVFGRESGDEGMGVGVAGGDVMDHCLCCLCFSSVLIVLFPLAFGILAYIYYVLGGGWASRRAFNKVQ
eukprot:GHVQ01003867.1.p1 GENE.GHVQ01003867.1~~GHVQ01003867.1.p1  ORF type:complete len:111 (-),score=22.44 GHVQ01003867.1:64-375(-)